MFTVLVQDFTVPLVHVVVVSVILLVLAKGGGHFTLMKITGGRPPPTPATSKYNRYDRYVIMGVDFGVIWAADFDNAIRFFSE